MGLPDVAARVARFSYAGFSTTVTQQQTVDGATATVSSSTDKSPAGLVVRTVDGQGAVQTFQYDALGNLERTFDAMPTPNVVAIQYDAKGRKLAMSDPNKGNWRYTYNALGELQSQTNARNQSTSFEYDTLGRLTKRIAPDESAQFDYDLAGGNSCASDGRSSLGLLCRTVSTGGGSSNRMQRDLRYDGLLRPVSETARLYAGNGAVEKRFVNQTVYDTLGRVQKRIYPSGYSVGYAYTALGALQSVNGPDGKSLWTPNKVNALGAAELVTLGNGVMETRSQDAYSGRLVGLGVSMGSYNHAQHSYNWNSHGDLDTRTDAFGLNSTLSSETFQYDAVHRLRRYSLKGGTTASPTQVVRDVSVVYNALGNILSRSDVGNYVYAKQGDALPHAVRYISGAGRNTVYGYDDAGNLIAATEGSYQQIDYTSFNQPDGVGGIQGRNGTRYTYAYDESQRRVVERRSLNGQTRITYKLHPDNAGGLGFEQEVAPDGSISNRHYLSASGGAFAMVETRGALYAAGQEDSGSPQAAAAVVVRTEYWHKDHLGSIVAVTNADGSVRARYAYDPWGGRRRPDGSLGSDYAGDYPNGTDRGFTGHEQLDDVGLVHMNGRLYDSALGRMLQADPFVQEPYLLQNYNAYSYVLNNPMAATDPDGRFFWFIAAGVFVARATGIIDQRTFRALVGIGAAVLLGPGGSWALVGGSGAGTLAANAAIAGFASGAISSGNLQGGFQGMFTSMLFFGAGQIATELGAATQGFSAGRVALHALAGCINASVAGGSCGQGAISAGFTKALGSAIPDATGDGARAINSLKYAMIGGTVAVLGGDKFANGALTGAAQYLFNQAVSDAQKQAHVLEDPRKYIGNVYRNARENAECVEFARQVGGAPHTSQWQPGDPISIENQPPVGTWVATFVNERYEGHVGAFVGFKSDGTLILVDQFRLHEDKPVGSPWRGDVVDQREYRVRPPNYTGRISNDPSKYRVLKW